MPLFSIIVPVYNVEECLERCVNSIISQSFKDFELILVDDGSPDKCPQICDEFAENDERITVIHKENGGVSSARNAGIDAAKGDYIWFVDSDDAIEADSLCFLAEKIKKTRQDLYVFNSKFNAYIDIKNFDDFFVKYYFKYLFGFGPWNKLYFTKIIKDNELKFDDEEKIGEDLLFNINVYCFVSSIAVYEDQLYSYIIREGSAMTTQSKERHINQMRLFRKIKNLMKNKVSEETLATLFFMHLVSGLNQSLLGGLTNKEYKALWAKYINESGFEKKILKKALNKFLDNEGASLLGRIRMKLIFAWYLV